MARLYPDTKFLRARASSLGFTSTTPVSRLRVSRPERRRHEEDDDDDDPYDETNQRDDDAEDEDNADLDMLPTMLVYRDGDLVHNWIRVDWEAEHADVEGLLDRSVLVASYPSRQFPSLS